MIQLQILSGQQAGHDIVVRRFPFLIGRGEQSGLRLDEAGVWDRHLEIEFQRGLGFAFRARPEAPAIINGEQAGQGILRHGDLIELGSARLRFWLARTRQRGLRFREALTWAALVAIFISQGVLIWQLLR